VCGFAGIARSEPGGITREVLACMGAAIRHRGPDGAGVFVGDDIGLAHVRLSVVDLAGGAQPLANEDGNLVVVYNGEIYNHADLRAELIAHGHRFRTTCDTEVIVHGYEQWGQEMLHRFNGQFSFALYDRRDRSVFLARDRFGVRPLFYAQRNGSLLFASEVKALFATGEVSAEPDFEALDEVYTFWATTPPRTPFRGVSSLEPGCCALWRNGRLSIRRYYTLDFSHALHEPADAMESLDALMRDSVRVRMRADVPVGGYLSGGLDSTITCTLAAQESPYDLRTFSVTFDDPQLDESRFQSDVARRLGSVHEVARIGQGDIGRVFPQVIRHTETPLIRTAPAPMYLLSRLTRDAGIKVVLTGEGADEVFLGYDLFKETLVRHFCLRQPQSNWRPRLLDRLYPYQNAARGGEFWRGFFLNSGTPADPLFSHLPRFQLTSRIKDFYRPEMRERLAGFDPLEELRARLPESFMRWSPVNRAAYLEFTTLLSPYLLSSQGDRMGMAHGIEGRFPYLDHRLFEFAASLPTSSKMLGLKEKHILRRWAADVVSTGAAARPKQPYRAPDIPAFFGAEEPGYVRELLDATALDDSGVFDPVRTAGLVRRCRSGSATGFRENQALVAILSTQLWRREFCGAGRTIQRTMIPARDLEVSVSGPAA
jgi:asparagine synthase (glutamine-hydrolysing)